MLKNEYKEIVFIVEEDPGGGYNANALGHNIFTQANTLPVLKTMSKDALHFHFENEEDRTVLLVPIL